MSNFGSLSSFNCLFARVVRAKIFGLTIYDEIGTPFLTTTLFNTGVATSV